MEKELNYIKFCNSCRYYDSCLNICEITDTEPSFKGKCELISDNRKSSVAEAKSINYEQFCENCKYYNFSLQKGILCAISNDKPSFKNKCRNFILNPEGEKKNNILPYRNLRKQKRSLYKDINIRPEPKHYTIKYKRILNR